MSTTIVTHTLGFPRMGVQRELKKSLEAYWAGKISQDELQKTGSEIRRRHWEQQRQRGVDLVPVGDFAWYDHVLQTSLMVGNIPQRHRQSESEPVTIDTLFRMGRGRAPSGTPAAAAEMTKWFNTNYHYMVPEFTSATQTFQLSWGQLLEELDEAIALFGAAAVKPVLLGPVTYAFLGKVKSEEKFDRQAILPNLVKVYAEVLGEIAKRGVEWVQIDEPALVLELDNSWTAVYKQTYDQLRQLAAAPKLLLTTYFDSVRHHLPLIASLPVDGLHVDLVNGSDDLAEVEKALPAGWVLSAGVISGRNIWKANLKERYDQLNALAHGGRHIWVGSSCSLLHSPVDLDGETSLDPEIKSWLSFALQKCEELRLLAKALQEKSDSEVSEYSKAVIAKLSSPRVVRQAVRDRLSDLTKIDAQRSLPFPDRSARQHELLQLPAWPTTTIGSFPQTTEIRTQRLDFKKGRTDAETYKSQLRAHIEYAIREQEKIDLDVLVHGEAERNDMVEYFGELLEGFAFTANGWVQSYGSRCVKPPIIYGDVHRPSPMTVEWSQYAQSLTSRVVKGMLTGPVTILCWSFPRDDLPRRDITNQLALALRDEVDDLQKNGIRVIQVDEPALREGLPLQRSQWEAYLDWAAHAFRLTASVAHPETQIHTHMCYAEVNDIIHTIAAMDADVISLEASRSDMELLEVFKKFTYPNEIGPGVYDIHSPNIPEVDTIVQLLLAAAEHIPVKQLWVNPDCGLKTRTWDESRAALKNMVEAAKRLRAEKPE
ncbi:Cobalamin-independent synthase, N-terminal domain/Cobalamin-independent synthase, Catalytic domain containing protein, putative [Angomonas deanei]|uniref:5-methyltetrahydropteroyltriglutamate--homocysteine S-methyltransferase n=1 Tax=Angomonas deanei TaxID=59799 RepID=U5KL59_9TRYP|nr:5-methyltetrahydropteroyltriglutamate-homocysteine S-methyltransferase [Angomonas deanei]CAD2215657.1 Cobalamin-independent synthase, N-terminal domain/Cobalamin-independent synthase, Catalytic domain containing protein, putative [Angomonas deanei]